MTIAHDDERTESTRGADSRDPGEDAGEGPDLESAPGAPRWMKVFVVVVVVVVVVAVLLIGGGHGGGPGSHF